VKVPLVPHALVVVIFDRLQKRLPMVAYNGCNNAIKSYQGTLFGGLFGLFSFENQGNLDSGPSIVAYHRVFFPKAAKRGRPSTSGERSFQKASGAV
jgi:hypothetical protein